ncbi:cytochrome b561 [Mycoplana sp. BE70]|uniref:cytochrome b n=1 Tax=Mycoplana sp. BE70 TaxID=2817775 RepID=UPI00285B6E89|nr:cytochrome b/b6 domain-containing protein [Mycoplana sp. BE70]MDR6755526.1 cytochrome b561 [Mycoplana sp. BE70]
MQSAAVLSYSVPQRLVHWLMAALILFNLLFAEDMEKLWRVVRNGGTPSADQVSAANIHAYVGIAVLCLAVLRIALRLAQGAPDAPAEEPPLFKTAAKVVHVTFYLLFFALPLSGIAAYYFGIGGAALPHGGPLKLAMWILIVVHVAALFVHQFHWKTAVAQRMTKG